MQDTQNLVGYKVRFEESITETTKIKFMTDGILLKEFTEDKFLNKYDFIIIDEAHERGLNSDIILGLVKLVSLKNKSIKIIIMSATLETKKFQQFFNTANDAVKCNLIEIQGRFHPIEIYNLKAPIDNFIQATVNTILQINFTQDKGDVLVFLTGREDIEEVQKKLKEKK